ncbi:MAG: efflux RND transporter periplasmic adaptor subunit [Gammaproteobacteria bacterium]
MKTSRLYLYLTIAVALGAANSTFVQAASDDHDHDHDVHTTEDTQHSESENHKHQNEHGDTENQPHEEEENTSRIDNDMATQVGIGTTAATEQTLHQTITSYGMLSTGPEQLSHMRARFSGLITSVKASIGDSVKAGDLLAEVESDASLKKYPVYAPISGTIVQRHANTGEVTKDQVLFSIADFDTLWAEFRIYPAQSGNVVAGQKVEVISDIQRMTGKISHIIPALDKPYQLARVPLDNRQLGLSPGLLVEGRIIIDEFNVPLAVEKNGVQQLGGRSGVFVQEEDTYHFAPLVLGRKDEHYIEVLSGLEESQRYVNRNSYLIKADIEKSEAEHEH